MTNANVLLKRIELITACLTVPSVIKRRSSE
jgi:hypothetical protein